METLAMINSKKERGEMFAKYQPLCYRLAANFANKFPRLLYDDILIESKSALGVTLATWNTSGEPHSTRSDMTWVYTKTYYLLYDWCLNNQPKAKPFSQFGGDNAEETQEPASRFAAPENWFNGILRTIGEDARLVVSIIVAAPAEIVDELSPRAPKRSMRAVRRYLAENMGWDSGRIEKA